MHCASELHSQAVKRIVGYVKGTISYGIKLSHSQTFKYQGYYDSDSVDSIDDMKSTLDYCFGFGTCILTRHCGSKYGRGRICASHCNSELIYLVKAYTC